MRLLIFFSVFITVFGSAGYYVYIRMMQAFSGVFSNTSLVLTIYIFLLSSFFFGKILETYSIGIISNTLIRIGSAGAGFFLYAFLFVVLFDLIRLTNFIIPFYPSFLTTDYQKTKLVVGIISLAIISITYIFGYINARTPKVTTLDITISKKLIGLNTLNVVAVSDIHLGTNINTKRTKRLINSINKLEPDLVLFGGDLIDDNIKVVKHFELLKHFKDIKSKYGVYSCLGNHEYISKAYNDLDSFEDNGIRILKDETIKVDDKFYIIGRDDIEGKSINGKERKSIEELTKDIDFELPVFILDHQPYKLATTAKFPIDLQFSGHTHNGQIWPFNYITGLLFEEDWGYLKKENTHYYISSGYGTAVMPIKVGNNSEIVNFTITGK